MRFFLFRVNIVRRTPFREARKFPASPKWKNFSIVPLAYENLGRLYLECQGLKGMNRHHK